MTEARAVLAFKHEGRVAEVKLAAPKANILDLHMMADLEEAVGRLAPRRDLVAIVLTAEGPHFSYGASVEEHLPDQINDVLPGLHRLLRRWLTLPAPTLAAVRGRCLGGGLELALTCDLILVEETAQLGVPEIQLGVFPPAASAFLPVRIGAGPAASLILTGESWSGKKAAEFGLASRTTPEGELQTGLDQWLEETFLPRSPAGLRHAALASRRSLRRAALEELPELERQYLHELMAEADAIEGIHAFLEKRQPVWKQNGPAV
jgi:cyclohexa-1,5-dienecarbonyl-CoA hydratase